MALRLQGYSYAAIGERLGVSRQRVQQLLSPPPALRDLVVAKTAGRCADCGLVVGQGHIHHREAVGATADAYNDPENLVLLCGGCHLRAHWATTPRAPKPDRPKNPAAVALGRLGGLARTAAQAAAARRNGRRGGLRSPQNPRL